MRRLISFWTSLVLILVPVPVLPEASASLHHDGMEEVISYSTAVEITYRVHKYSKRTPSVVTVFKAASTTPLFNTTTSRLYQRSLHILYRVLII